MLVDCSTVLEDSSSESTGNEASGIKRVLIDIDFLIWLDFFVKVCHMLTYCLVRYNQLQLLLQKLRLT